MPSVFISRPLGPQSPFVRLQLQATWELTAVSLLQFKALPCGPVPQTDWLFFYSRRGVDFLLQQHPLPANAKLAVIGPGTAESIRKNGYELQFVGQGAPEQVAAAFLQLARSQQVLFVQALHSRQSVQQILGDQVVGVDLVVYQNTPGPRLELAAADYLIFTSPLNFVTYQQHYRISSKQRLIGIGPTTGQSFQSAGIVDYRIARQSTEAALLACLLEWEEQSPIDNY